MQHLYSKALDLTTLESRSGCLTAWFQCIRSLSGLFYCGLLCCRVHCSFICFSRAPTESRDSRGKNLNPNSRGTKAMNGLGISTCGMALRAWIQYRLFGSLKPLAQRVLQVPIRYIHRTTWTLYRTTWTLPHWECTSTWYMVPILWAFGAPGCGLPARSRIGPHFRWCSE